MMNFIKFNNLKFIFEKFEKRNLLKSFIYLE